MPVESTFFFIASITRFPDLRVENNCSSLESRLRQTTEREIPRLCFLENKMSTEVRIVQNNCGLLC